MIYKQLEKIIEKLGINAQIGIPGICLELLQKKLRKEITQEQLGESCYWIMCEQITDNSFIEPIEKAENYISICEKFHIELVATAKTKLENIKRGNEYWFGWIQDYEEKINSNIEPEIVNA